MVVPFSSSDLAVARDLPAGRHRAGDRHLKFHDYRDNLDQDITTTFCQYVHFFAAPAHGTQWTSSNDGTFLLDLDTAFEVGARWNRARGFI